MPLDICEHHEVRENCKLCELKALLDRTANMYRQAADENRLLRARVAALELEIRRAQHT